MQKTSITSHKRRKTNRNATISSMSVILWNYVAFFDCMSLYIVIRLEYCYASFTPTIGCLLFLLLPEHSKSSGRFAHPLSPCARVFWRLLVNYIVAICFMLPLMYMNTRLTKHNRNKRLSSTHTGFLPKHTLANLLSLSL